MDDAAAISLNLRIADLESRLSRKDAEAAVLVREIQSPHTTDDQKYEAMAQRESILSELRTIYADLVELRRS